MTYREGLYFVKKSNEIFRAAMKYFEVRHNRSFFYNIRIPSLWYIITYFIYSEFGCRLKHYGRMRNYWFMITYSSSRLFLNEFFNERCRRRLRRID